MTVSTDRSSWWAPAAGFALGTLVGLAGLEIWLHHWLNQNYRSGVAPTLNTLRGAYQYTGVTDEGMTFDPDLGWVLQKNWRSPGADNDNQIPYTVSTGPFGDRLTGDASGEGGLKIAAFGDSFTFGFGVADDEAWPARLSHHLGDRGSVTNHGVSGYGDDQVALALYRWLPVVQPDIVILARINDDSWRNRVRWSFGPKPGSLLEDGRWVLSGSPVPPPHESRASWIRPPLFRHLPDLLAEARTDRGGAEELALAEVIVEAQVEAVLTHGAIPILVHLTHAQNNPWGDRVTDRVCDRLRVFCTNTHDAFVNTSKAGHEPISSLHGHYGPEMNDEVARTLVPLVLGESPVLTQTEP